MEPFRLAVIGAGTMGAGIAGVAAAAGFRVCLVDPDDRALTRAEEKPVEGILYASELPPEFDAGAVIEAVPEQLELKMRVLREIAGRVGPRTLIATNTSSLSVDMLAAAAGDRARFLGLHFFNPPAAMQLVEVIPGDATAPEVIQAAVALVARLGKRAVVARDTPGFIVNRIARPYYIQAFRALAAGIAPARTIDELAEGIGFPLGPFALMDRIGHDVNFAATSSIYERTGAARLRPPERQRELVAQKRLGVKSGAGVYEYEDSRPGRSRIVPVERSAAAALEAGLVLVVGNGMLARALHAALMESGVATIASSTAMTALDSHARAHARPNLIVDAIDEAGNERLAALEALVTLQIPLAYDATLTPPALAAALRPEGGTVGHGFIGPVTAQHIVELVRTGGGGRALALVEHLLAALGVRPVFVEPIPALYVARTVCAIVNEAYHALEESVASAGEIDLAMRLGTRYPFGPFEWAKSIGPRRVALVLEALSAEEPDDAPAGLLRAESSAA